MRKPIITVLAAAAAFVATSGAIAKEPLVEDDTKVSVTVSYADLDLKTAEGMAALTRRIDRAADRVCERATPLELRSYDAWQECKAKARDGAMEQLDGSAVNTLSLNNPFDGIELASVF
jgi:UrcA family protein